jgi:mono/diheme cytochrome c family protein
MPYGYSTDPELDRSTNRVMVWGVVLLAALILVFPLYLLVEPSSREDAREENLASLATQGETLWEFNCASCHGENGEGVSAPTLNSQEFLQAASDEQTSLLISVGVPGTAMSAFGQDFAGPLTSEQVEAVTAFIRQWEDDAPEVPNWRDPDTQGASG